MPRYGTIDHDYGLRLATTEPADDGPVHMLNLMKYRAVAHYRDGSGPEGVSGREADDRYVPRAVLAEIGAAICFAGDVVASSEDWDRVGVVRYPTRKSFIDMQSRRDFQDQHVHKDAGMDHTIVMGTRPRDGLPGTGAPRVLLEVWDGDTPAPVPGTAPVTFDVEGTIVGDGRPWTGARYSALDEGAPVDLSVAGPAHQLLVLDPIVERW